MSNDEIREAAEEYYESWNKINPPVSRVVISLYEHCIHEDRKKRGEERTIDLNNLKKKEHKHISLSEARDIALDSIPEAEPPPIYGFEDMEESLSSKLERLMTLTSNGNITWHPGVGIELRILNLPGKPTGCYQCDELEQAIDAALDGLKGKGDNDMPFVPDTGIDDGGTGSTEDKGDE